LDPAEHAEVRVLIAEPHRTVADSLNKLISSLGNASVAARAHDTEQALEIGSKLGADVAIVDLDLSPNCTLVAGLHRATPETRIIVMADKTRDADLLVRALATGAVGAIYKDSSIDDLARAIRSSSRRSPVVADEAAGLLLSSYVDSLSEKRQRDVATISALAAALEVRDAGTGQHVRRVVELAQACMEQIDPGLAGNEEVAYGFMLHDVGKIGVPDAILRKPGPLTKGEWGVMRRHPEMGVQIVGPIGFTGMATGVILCHHERWDGQGYPHGLAKDEIPLPARTFAVADAYDAMTSDRPYRSAVGHTDALEHIDAESGASFDPEVVEVFVDLVH
jgi:response regulator RpfG family c-di-GMP phosphodiesterase